MIKIVVTIQDKGGGMVHVESEGRGQTNSEHEVRVADRLMQVFKDFQLDEATTTVIFSGKPTETN